MIFKRNSQIDHVKELMSKEGDRKEIIDTKMDEIKEEDKQAKTLLEQKK